MWTCSWAVKNSHIEVLRWAREHGALWGPATRDRAAAKLGYTDDLGNDVSVLGIGTFWVDGEEFSSDVSSDEDDQNAEF